MILRQVLELPDQHARTREGLLRVILLLRLAFQSEFFILVQLVNIAVGCCQVLLAEIAELLGKLRCVHETSELVEVLLLQKFLRQLEHALHA